MTPGARQQASRGLIDSDEAAVNSSNSEESAEQAISAYVLPGAPPDVAELIRPARAPRQWMDRTPDRYVYRCIPLSAANTMGWEILNPVACELLWNGLTPPDQVFVYQQNPVRYGPRSHFGSGVVTWELPFLFRTPPGYGLVVCGPGNHDHPHISPLDAFVRTDWLPFPFTVNWRLTAKGEPVRFEKHEPIARVFPFPLNLLEETRVELADLGSNPKLESEFHEWREQRTTHYQQRRQAEARHPQGDIQREGQWSRRYARGADAKAAGHRHQTVFRCAEVHDGRESARSAVSRSGSS